jgi:dienelactone hydrolase
VPTHLKTVLKPCPKAVRFCDGPIADTNAEIWQEIDVGTTGSETWVRNVSQSTLTPFLPQQEQANGAAVLVIPGGGLQFVSISNEGWSVAQALADQGVAAFVLKYRVETTPEDEARIEAALAERFKELQNPLSPTPVILAGIDRIRADAQAALRQIRSNASEWRVDPNRVGMLGFSAGAMATFATALAAAPDATPDFIATIYGFMKPIIPPPMPPPLFAAIASDDALFGKQGFGLIESWQKAGGSVECPFYSAGGHGFGLKNKNTTSDFWFEQFVAWMKAEIIRVVRSDLPNKHPPRYAIATVRLTTNKIATIECGFAVQPLSPISRCYGESRRAEIKCLDAR